MNNALALHVQTPDVVGAYNEGVNQEQGRQMNALNMQGKQQSMELQKQEAGREEAANLFKMIGSVGMHALGGDINGQPDPQKWSEGLDFLGQMGLDVEKYRSNPGIAKVAVDSSVSALDRLKLARDDREFQFLLQKFDQDVSNSNRNYALDVQKANVPKAPDMVTLYDEATGQEYKAQFNPETGGFDRVGGIKAPSGMSIETRPDGTVSVTQGMPGASPKLTEQQGKDLVYYERGAGSLPTLDQHGDTLLNAAEAVGGSAPWVGNYLKSPEYQQAEQAGLEFLQAILRKDTGAAITPQETAEYGKVYLPRPGDSAQVLAQKKVARHRALDAIRKGLGPAEILAAERPANGDVKGEAAPGTKVINGVTYQSDGDGGWFIEE